MRRQRGGGQAAAGGGRGGGGDGGRVPLQLGAVQVLHLEAGKGEGALTFERFVVRRPSDNPTIIASVQLVIGCPNSRAGVKMVKKIP